MNLPDALAAAPLATAVLLWALVSGTVALVAVWRRWRVPRAMGSRPAGPCVLVRPCAGDEPHLVECLTSVLRARRSFDPTVLLLVPDAADPALSGVQRACAELCAAGLEARVLIGADERPNQKAALLARAEDAAPPGDAILVCADANVDLDGFDLDALLAPLGAGGAAVWAPAIEPPPRTLGDRASLAVLGGSLHAFAILGCLDPRGLVGKLFAVRRDGLRRIGGFGPLADFLGEDMELSRRLRRAGLKTAFVPQPVRTRSGPRRLRDTIARHARWLAVIRGQRAHLLPTYPLLFCSTTPILLLALLAAPTDTHLAAAAASYALGTRLVLGLAAQRWSARRPGLASALVDVLLGDLVLWGAMVCALTSRTLTWRGRRLRLQPGGTIGVEDTGQPR